jgi:hypothetical protein
LGDFPGAVGVLNLWFISLLVTQAVGLTVKDVNLFCVRARVRKDEATIVADDGAQHFSIAVFATHFGELSSMAKFAILNRCGAQGVQRHRVCSGMGRKNKNVLMNKQSLHMQTRRLL